MNKLDILYGLEVILFKHKKTKKDFIILQKLRNKNLIDWFSWYDEKIGHFKYDINTTHKGLLYYTKNKNKRRYKTGAIIGSLTLLFPFIFLIIPNI